MYYLRITLFFIFVVEYSFAQSHQLQELLDIALKSNLELKAISRKVDAAKEKSQQMNFLDPPAIGVEFYQIPVNTINVFKTSEYDYFIEQMFPFPGKIRARVAPEEKMSDMISEELEYSKLKLRNHIKRDFFDLYMMQKKIDVLTESAGFLRKTISSAATSYEVGKMYQEDVTRLELELAKLIQDSISYSAEKKRMEIMLNNLANRPGDVKFNRIEDFTLSEINVDSLILQKDRFNLRPDLKAMKINLAVNDLEINSTKKEYLPDFMLRLMYKDMGMEMPHFWSFMVSVNLPFMPWSKPMIDYKLEEREAKKAETESSYEWMKLMISGDVSMSITKIEESKKKLSIYNSTLIPKAEDALNSNVALYENGKVNILMVLDGYRMLQMFKMDYYMAIAEYEKSIADYELATGQIFNNGEQGNEK
jgi:outer membrane protein, heavy metal efflux system